MTMLHVRRLGLLVALAGCSAASGNSVSGSGGGFSGADAGAYARGGNSASSGGYYGMGGSTGGGGMAVLVDAGLPTGDAGRGEPIPSNLSSDGPVFGADGCASCKPDTGSVDSPIAADSGRSPDAFAAAGGSGGSAGGTGSGGALSSSGGASGFGGSVGFGGSTAAGSGGSGSGGSGVAGSGAGGAHADAGGGPDAIVPVSDAGADTGADTTASSCVARIRAIVPATDSLDAFDNLFAGPNVQVVLRAEVVSLGPTSPVWSWQCTRDGVPVTNVVLGQQDPAIAAFPIASPGNYTFTARDKTGACVARAQAGAAGANDCPDCDRAVLLHIAPSPSSDLPVQDGFRILSGSSPFSSTTIIPSVGVAARIAPSVNGGRVDAYVRVSQSGGKLITDGLAAASSGAAGFPVNVVSTDSHGLVQYYDVLVVPIDGINASTIAATAPQLFASLSAGDISRTSFSLSGGVSVTGTVTDASGAPVSDVRVILSNRNPSTPGQSSSLIFSSVGRSDAQGRFVLHAQPGTYWISISPPSGSGLPEALVSSSVTLSGDTTLSFQWDQPSTAVVALTVVDAVGMPTSGTRVRLTSAGSGKVGTLTSGSSSQPAQGNVQAQGITSSLGTVSFPNVPDGTTYGVLLAPSPLGPSAATTVLSLTVPAGGTTQMVRLLPQGSIQGQLSAGVATDWTQVSVVAYDRSDDSPEAPFSILAGADGRFTLPVSPGRPYVLLAVPSAESGLARTFVGPGLLAASEFTIKQKVQSSMPWISTAYQTGYDLSGTALQVLCGPGYAGCVDPTIPLAETTIEGGAFQLALPDPSTR
jgi:hypothetical protein